MSVEVSLSSGETFYVDAELIAVEHRLYHEARSARGFADHMVMIGNRAVNPSQVAQLQYVREVSTVHVSERLEED